MPVMARLWLVLLPELGQFPDDERDAAFRKAAATELDVVELIGMAFALVLVTAATQYALPDQSLLPRLSATFLNFIVAVPLIGLVAGALHIRRLRRGLRAQLREPEHRHE